MMQERGMFIFILLDTCGGMRKKMHVRQEVRERMEKEKQTLKEQCYVHVFPYL